MKNIIFVCTGNTCRSPMAEAIAKNLFKDKDLNIISRGIFVYDSFPINENSKVVLKENNININEHFSKQLSLEEFEKADLIFTMEIEHKNLLKKFNKNVQEGNEKVFTLYEYVLNKEQDIKDPFGFNLEIYKKCFEEIYFLISKINF